MEILKQVAGVDRFCGHTIYLRGLMSGCVTVIDGGGNIGSFAGAINKRFDARIYSFEPDSSFHGKLSVQTTRIIPKAITARSGETTFYQSSNGEAGNLLGPVECVSVFTCNTVALEQFVKFEGIRHIDLLKLDIEGSEIEVLLSLPDCVLQITDQISVEYHEQRHPEHAIHIAAIDRRLIKVGFRRYRFSYPQLSDVLYLNRRLGAPHYRMCCASAVGVLARSIRKTILE